MMTKNADVIIIGGGVIGCSAAYNLAKRGVSVLVLESDIIGHGASCSNAGGVRQSARDDRELPMAMFAVKNLWPHLSDELGVDVEYCQRGNLRIGITQEHLAILKELSDRCCKSGLNMEVISGDEARSICPDLSPNIVGAGWCATDGHASPLMTTLGYYRKARMLGARFITGEKVIEIKKYQGKARTVVTQNGNSYEADTILLAAGYDSREIANTVGIDFPVAKVFDECIVTEVRPAILGQMLGTADADFYGYQAPNGSFVFGGDSGFERFHKFVVDNKDSSAITPSCIARSIVKYIPSLTDAKITHHWAGWLDKCSDGVPVISKIPEVPGLVLAAGFSGHGFGISPAVGQILAELITDNPLCCDISSLRYDRFKAKA